MTDHLREYWWIYVGLTASVLYLGYLLRRRGGDEPLLRRLVFSANPRSDPQSDKYDPTLHWRQLRLLLIGAILIGLAHLVVWWLNA